MQKGVIALNIEVKCPVCGSKLPLSIDLSSLKSVSGLYYIPIIHDDHGFLLYVDQNGMVRGYQIFDRVVKVENTDLLGEMIKLILQEDTKHLSLAIAGALLDVKMSIYSGGILKILEFLDLGVNISDKPILEEAPDYLINVAKVFHNFLEEIKKRQSVELLLVLKRMIIRYKDMLAKIEEILNNENEKRRIPFFVLAERAGIINKPDLVIATSFLERHKLSSRVIYTLI